MIFAIDFDGTCVDHRFPDVGMDVPGAVEWIKKISDNGGKIILWTMRSVGQNDGDVLQPAIDWFSRHNILLYGVNQNPHQWSSSPKAYAHVYVDDAAFGCPLKDNPRMGGRPYVDWSIVGPRLLAMLGEKNG